MSHVCVCARAHPHTPPPHTPAHAVPPPAPHAQELFPGNFLPTPTHYFMRLLHEKGMLLRVFTQNIDSLETLAGLPKDKVVAAVCNVLHHTVPQCPCTAAPRAPSARMYTHVIRAIHGPGTCTRTHIPMVGAAAAALAYLVHGAWLWWGARFVGVAASFRASARLGPCKPRLGYR